MIYEIVDAKKAEIPIDRSCRLLGVSSSGYYAWTRRQPSRRQYGDMILLAHVRYHFELSRETVACPGESRGEPAHACGIESVRDFARAASNCAVDAG